MKNMNTKKYITFTAKRNNVQIEGYIDIDEIDDENCTQYLNHQGLPNGFNMPKNPYDIDTIEYEEYESLKKGISNDDLLLQWLWDCQDGYRTIERPSYTLIINPDYEK